MVRNLIKNSAMFGGILARKIQISDLANFHQIEFLDKIGFLPMCKMRLFLKISPTVMC